MGDWAHQDSNHKSEAKKEKVKIVRSGQNSIIIAHKVREERFGGAKCLCVWLALAFYSFLFYVINELRHRNSGSRQGSSVGPMMDNLWTALLIIGITLCQHTTGEFGVGSERFSVSDCEISIE